MKTKRSKQQILKRKFDFGRPRNGQLVVTAEIMRVTNNKWGIQQKGWKKGQFEIEVQDLLPKGGSHIVSFGQMGQQCVMILKPNKRRASTRK